MNKIVNLKLKVAIKDSSKPENRIASISTILGPRGIKPIEFLRKFDDAVSKSSYALGSSVIVRIQAVMEGGKASSYIMNVYGYDLSSYIRTKLGFEKFSSKHTVSDAKYIDREVFNTIVNERMETLNTLDFAQAYKIVEGSLKSYNVRIK